MTLGDERLTEYDMKFAYNSRWVGYTTLMSDMDELYAIMEEERLVDINNG